MQNLLISFHHQRFLYKQSKFKVDLIDLQGGVYLSATSENGKKLSHKIQNGGPHVVFGVVLGDFFDLTLYI